MSETLIGVLFGGLIASISPLATLVVESRRRRRELKLEHLRAERRRLETLFAENPQKLSEGMANDVYHTQMIADISVFMPKVIGDLFEEWMRREPKDKQAARVAYLNICMEMKKVLADVDKEIEAAIDV